MRIDEFAKFSASKAREARLHEQALFAARVIRNGWAIAKTCAYYGREAGGWWLTVVIPVLIWSSVLEFVLWYATPPFKFVALGLLVGLYVYIVYAIRKYLLSRNTSQSIRPSASEQPEENKIAEAPSRKAKSWNTFFSHLFAAMVKMF